MPNNNLSKVEISNNGKKLILSHSDLVSIFRNLNIFIEDPKQRFEVEVTSSSGGRRLTELFDSGDEIVIEYLEETIAEEAPEPEVPIEEGQEPIRSCKNCFPNTFTIFLTTFGCGESKSVFVTKFKENDPPGTYNKIWRGVVNVDSTVPECPGSYFMQIECVSFNSQTNQAVLNIKSMDETFTKIIQFASFTSVVPCPAIPDGSILINFSGIIYPGFIESILL